MKLANVDFVYLSYNEPNCEEIFAYNKHKIPWLKRVHGVTGFDAAHKACADASDTEYFVTIDADTKIDPKFLDIGVDMREYSEDPVISWPSRNIINGLCYGNGSLKLWNKRRVYEQQTHENSNGDASSVVEFCFADYYYNKQECYSTTHVNGSPEQAFRAGYREGVKMTLNRGEPTSNINFLYPGNVMRLETWCNVGRDVENGRWAMLGAIEGAKYQLTSCFSPDEINNFDSSKWRFDLNNNEIDKLITQSGNVLKTFGLKICHLDEAASAFVKALKI